MVNQENQTSKYQCQEDLGISGREHFQQEMIAGFPALLHQETLPGRQKQGIIDSTCQDKFFQLVQHADQLVLCNHSHQQF